MNTPSHSPGAYCVAYSKGKMRRSQVLVAASLLLAVPATQVVAQPNRRPGAGAAPSNRAGNAAPLPQSPGAFRTATLFDPHQISLRTLPNGVRSVVKPTRGAGTVAVQVWVKAGSRHEKAGEIGAAHLVGEAALNGSRDYAFRNGGAQRAISALGSELAVQTSRDSTSFGATVAPHFLADAVDALSDATLRPDLSAAALNEARNQALNDIDARDTDPVSTATDLAYAAGFSRHPYRRSVYGSDTDVKTIAAQRVQAFHQARYRGSNISVVIVGDVDVARAHALVAEAFGTAPAASASDSPPAPEANALPSRTVKRISLYPRTTLSLGFRAPGIQTPEDVVAMDVLLSFWNEGSNAYLKRLLTLGPAAPSAPASSVEPKPTPDDKADDEPAQDGSGDIDEGTGAAALGLDIAFLTQRDPGVVTFTMVAEPENIVRSQTLVLNEIKRVRGNGLSNAELNRARQVLWNQYIAQSETPGGQAGGLGFYEMLGGYDFAVTYLDRIARVTSADIKRVANRYFSPDNFVRVLIEPAPLRTPEADPDGIPEPRADGSVPVVWSRAAVAPITR